ncbi:MAG: deoxyribose-phosphate aldolase [Minisyncoccales bacterium]|jgi:deoxyribose-phosphate aldolase
MKINKYIDHTNIKKEAKKEDIIKTCEEAKKYQFRGVCVRPKWVKLVSNQLSGTGIKTVVLIDDPIGDSSYEERLKMSKKAVSDGADELDIVINIPDVIHGRWSKIEKDLKAICRLQNTKVIIGSGFLTDDDIAKASQIVKKAGAICVKTATEKDPLENRELKEKGRHLEIMRKNAPGLLIKASGNIKTLKDVKLMIKYGADIIGSSSGVSIMENK